MTPRNLLGLLYQNVVVGKEKAIAALLVTAIASYAAQHLGYHVSNGLQQLVISAIVGLIAHASVYFTNNTN